MSSEHELTHLERNLMLQSYADILIYADQKLERSIIKHLINLGRADLCKLQIRAKKGNIRLAGHLQGRSDLELLLREVPRVAGVAGIVCRVKLSDPEDSPAHPNDVKDMVEVAAVIARRA